jgi:catechol 2,3-dioxygenase-like lactoylglutathione lyase family enzyme
MIDHIGIRVRDFAQSVAFYTKALAPLDYVLVKKLDQFNAAGFGVGQKPDFWIEGGKAPTDRVHVAIVTKSRKNVDAFYAAAIAAGGKDNGPPGMRPHYHEHYYGAFVLDLDGHNIEAVCHEPYLA